MLLNPGYGEVSEIAAAECNGTTTNAPANAPGPLIVAAAPATAPAAPEESEKVGDDGDGGDGGANIPFVAIVGELLLPSAAAAAFRCFPDATRGDDAVLDVLVARCLLFCCCFAFSCLVLATRFNAASNLLLNREGTAAVPRIRRRFAYSARCSSSRRHARASDIILMHNGVAALEAAACKSMHV